MSWREKCGRAVWALASLLSGLLWANTVSLLDAGSGYICCRRSVFSVQSSGALSGLTSPCVANHRGLVSDSLSGWALLLIGVKTH